MNKKIAVITGASSGIGRELARILIDQYELFLCGRNREELNKTAVNFDKTKHSWEIIELDLSNSNSIKLAAELILIKSKRIHLLINNAGVSQRALANQTSEQVERELFQVNYFGPVAFTKLLLPNLRNAKGATIAITSSIVGKFGYPLRSSYSAAKHALHGYFESLRFEEKPNDIKIQLFVIGRAKTNVSINAKTSNGEKYGKMDKGQDFGISPKNVSKSIVSALGTNKKEILIGGSEIWMVRFKKYFPFLFYKIADKKTNHV